MKPLCAFSSYSSSSAVSSGNCWYSEARSFSLISASMNPVSFKPSLVHQCEEYSPSDSGQGVAVVLQMGATAILGTMSHTPALMPFGIHDAV